MQSIYEKMLNLFHIKSISQKISLAFILFFTILIMVVIMVFRVVYENLMFTKLEERAEYESRLVAQQIGKFVDSINSCTNSLIINLNANINQEFQMDFFPDSTNIETNRNMFNTMDSNTLMFSMVDRVSIVFENDTIYSKDNKDPLHNSLSKKTGIYQYLNQLGIDSKGKWCYRLDENLQFDLSALCYIKSLRNISQNRIIGYVIICIDEIELYRLYRNVNSTQFTKYFVYNNEYEIISSSERDEISQDIYTNELLRIVNIKTDGAEYSGIIHANNERYYYRLTKVNYDQWYFVSFINLDQALKREVNLITIAILAVSIVSIAVFYVIIICISRKIAEPIQKLARHMMRFQNTLPEVIPESSAEDETGILISSFNTMVQNNKELFSRLIKEEREKEHYELALMQTQIKPHFLYNTLDTVYCLVDMDRLDEAKKAIKLLAQYYRIVLNRGSEWIPLEKELEAIQKYLEIQKFRYGKIINYEIDVSFNIMYLQIPKLTLQPLVENAIYHGIKLKNRPGNILITGEMRGAWIYIRISDDGVGMTREEFEQVLLAGKNDESHNFGLKNVEKRLKLFYGDESGLSIENDSKYSTTILISIYLGSSGEAHV